MNTSHFVAAALLRRGRVSLDTLAEVETRIRNSESLVDIFFRPEILDLAPDIFPPHLVGAFIDRDDHQGVRIQDTCETYFQRLFRSRKQSTLRMLSRQLHAAAKSDATRRTTTVHPVEFDGVSVPTYKNEQERYFIFPELFAEQTLEKVKGKVEGQKVFDAMDRYRLSAGKDVPDAFFALMDACKELGLHQQRAVKHKYPLHGLMYGSPITLPQQIKPRLERAGNVILEDLVSLLPHPGEAFCFSIDFFLTAEGNIFMGRDIHEQQIGMGLQRQLGVNSSREFYNAVTQVLGSRAPAKEVSLYYDEEVCLRNQLYRMEVQALREHLQSEGFKVSSNTSQGYVLRLFGGKEGIPTARTTTLTDNKLLIDDILEKHREELADLGVYIPKTYRCVAMDVINSPERIAEALHSEQVFIHPTIHHGFKPFELDLRSMVSATIVQETFAKRNGAPLHQIPIVVMERIPNSIEFAGQRYAHEVRTYFVPEE